MRMALAARRRGGRAPVDPAHPQCPADAAGAGPRREGHPDEGRAVLPAGARRRDRRLHDARPGGHRAPRRLHQRGQRAGHSARRPGRLGRRGRLTCTRSAIKIEAWDRQGLLRDIATVVAENRVNMSALEVHVLRRQDGGRLRDRRDRLAGAALAPDGKARGRARRAHRRARSLLRLRVESTADRQFGDQLLPGRGRRHA